MRRAIATRALFSVVAVILLIALVVLARMPRDAEAQEPIAGAALRYVSQVYGLPEEELRVLNQAVANYPLAGQSWHHVKVMDIRSGQTYGVYLDTTGAVVDETRFHSEEAAAYAEGYGKLSPALHDLLQRTASDEMVKVAIWLKSDIEDLVGMSPADTEAQLSNLTAAAEAPIVDFLTARGFEVRYVSEFAPLVFTEVPAWAIAELAQRPGVDMVYLSRVFEPETDSAAITEKANFVWQEGLRGQGISVAVVEADGVEFNNPYLADGSYYDSTTLNLGDHATFVAGVIASTHATYRGVAHGATLLSANSQTYDDAAIMAATEWAINQGAHILNDSWGSDTNLQMEEMDRYLDYIVRNMRRTIVKSAGNNGDGWGTQTGNITSPGLGYNMITVGSFNDHNAPHWSDDTISDFSSFNDPISTHADREKPEVAAPGEDITSTGRVDPWLAGPGSGTSYAAPVVAGEAALLMEAASALTTAPEAVKAIIMASAFHNIEGDTRLSERDGAGGIDALSAVETARNGWWVATTVDGTSFDASGNVTYTMPVLDGQKMRVAICWDSNPAGDYSTDPLDADLDLCILDPNDALVSCSSSWDNSHEIVEFTAGMTGNYTIRVHRFRFDGSSEYLGVAWADPALILQPTRIQTAYAGPHDKPHKIIVKTPLVARALSKDEFTVQIGGLNATVLIAYEASDSYTLEVMPPQQAADGLYDLRVTVSTPSGPESDIEVEAVHYAEAANADVVLVIDRSGSMGTAKMNAAKEAAKQFVDFMQVGDMIGVVSFSTSVSTNFPLTIIQSEDTKTQAKNAIDALYASGNTSIGGGLQRGQEQLSTLGDAAHPWAVVLLSDGLENTAPYVADVLPSIVATKTVVHTIGLGSDADEALMLDIATQTGGTYHFAATPEDLGNVYNTIVGAVTDQQVLLAEDGVAQQGVTDEKDVVVDSTVSEATFSVSWSGSSSDIDLTLRKPDGSVIDPGQAGADPNVDYVSGSTYEYYRVRTPTLAPGVWQMRVTGASIAATQEVVSVQSGGEPYVARVTAVAGLTMRFSLDGQDYLTTQAIKVIVTLSDDQPITGAAVHVNVEPPSQGAALIRQSEWIEMNGDTVPDPALVAELEATVVRAEAILTLYDDGAHGDGAAGDGVYANSYTPYSVGSYTFTALASGISNSGEGFVRTGDISTYVAKGPDLPPVYVPLVMRSYSGSPSPTGPQVRYASEWIDDDTWGNSYGNDDGMANPGEFLEVYVELENTGDEPAYGVYVVPTTADPYVNPYGVYFYDDNLWYGDMPAGTSTTGDDFDFMISSNAPSGHVINFHLDIHDSEGRHWTDNLAISVTGSDTTPPRISYANVYPKYAPVGTPATISAFVEEGGNINSAFAYVESPDETVLGTISLYDDGAHNDGVAGDRSFAGAWTPTTEADFYVDFEATDDHANTGTADNLTRFTSSPFTETADILLVIDQQWDYGYERYYENALRANGLPYDLWNSFVRGSVDSSTLDQYVTGVVIYSMPEYGYLENSSTQSSLMSYLDSGGRLFITGQDIGYSLTKWGTMWNEFYSDYLHATYVQDDIGLYGLNGVSGDPIGDGYYLSISGGDGANNQYYPDEIDPIAPAVTIFTYDPVATSGAGLLGVHNEGRARRSPEENADSSASVHAEGISSSGTGAIRVDTGTYKVVYFSFGFEAINDLGGNSRAEIMERVLSWLQPGIYARATENGSPASGLPINLYLNDGSSFSLVASTPTEPDGMYRFTGLPSLSPIEEYWVVYENTAGTPGRLEVWVTWPITLYTTGSRVHAGDFDVADISLVSPADGATVSLPYAFSWTPRPATPTDDYEFHLYESDGDAWWWTDPTLGYVGGYTLNSLPSGFYSDTEYVWQVLVYGQYGYGWSYEARSVTFSNTGAAAAESGVTGRRVPPEEMEDFVRRR